MKRPILWALGCVCALALVSVDPSSPCEGERSLFGIRSAVAGDPPEPTRTPKAKKVEPAKKGKQAKQERKECYIPGVILNRLKITSS